MSGLSKPNTSKYVQACAMCGNHVALHRKRHVAATRFAIAAAATFSLFFLRGIGTNTFQTRLAFIKNTPGTHGCNCLIQRARFNELTDFRCSCRPSTFPERVSRNCRSSTFVDRRRQAAMAIVLGLFGQESLPAIADVGDAKKLVLNARTSVAECLENYQTFKNNKLPEEGFKNLRRYLGTVGTESPLFPGPGKSGPLEAAYRGLAEASGDSAIAEISEELTGHLRKADDIASSAFRGRSRRCKDRNGAIIDCVPVFFDDTLVELKQALQGFDALLQVIA